MTRPRTPFWRGLGWAAVSCLLSGALATAVVLGIGAGVVR